MNINWSCWIPLGLIVLLTLVLTPIVFDVLIPPTGNPAVNVDSAGVRAIPGVDNVKRIGILSAFGPELDLLLQTAKINKNVTINGRTFSMGTLKGKKVVLSKTGKALYVC